MFRRSSVAVIACLALLSIAVPTASARTNHPFTLQHAAKTAQRYYRKAYKTLIPAKDITVRNCFWDSRVAALCYLRMPVLSSNWQPTSTYQTTLVTVVKQSLTIY